MYNWKNVVLWALNHKEEIKFYYTIEENERNISAKGTLSFIHNSKAI